MKTFLQVFIIALAFAACTNSSEKSTSPETQEEMVNVEIVAEEVTYSTDSTQMKGYIAYDKAVEGKRPGILIIHEWWGHNDYVRMRADMLAELGYVAFAVDMYGDGKVADHPQDAGKFAGMVMQNLPAAKARFDAAYEQLANHPMAAEGQISAIGYCFGGSVALSMANAGKDLDGVAAFHSGIQLPIPPGEDLKAKIIVMNGGADPMIGADAIANFKAQLDSVNADYEYIEYPGVMHGYTNPGATELGKKFEIPLAYNQKADEDSWAKLQAFLDEIYK
jgi:dienelactone hydrolase